MVIVNLANTLSPYLTEEIRQTASRYELILSGTREPLAQEVMPYQLTMNLFGHILGDYYGKTFLGAEGRADIAQMVHEIIRIYEERLQANDWLSQETIQQAIHKLESMAIQVGYPDEISPVQLEVSTDPEATFFRNTLDNLTHLAKLNYSQYGDKVDRTQWDASPAMVNTFYNPLLSTIVFPAGILQAPFYSLAQSDSANCGGIGTIIAHEITHAFDNNGAQFDEYGNLANWWSEADYQAFQEQTQAMIEQFDGVPSQGGKANGELTVSENIADNGGLAAALKATSALDQPDYEAFFVKWAHIWHNLLRMKWPAYFFKWMFMPLAMCG